MINILYFITFPFARFGAKAGARFRAKAGARFGAKAGARFRAKAGCSRERDGDSRAGTGDFGARIVHSIMCVYTRVSHGQYDNDQNIFQTGSEQGDMILQVCTISHAGGVLRVGIISLIAAAVCIFCYPCSTCCQEAAIGSLTYNGSMELEYATCFSVDYYDGGYKYITIQGDAEYLVVPQDGEVPEGLDEDIVLLYQPLDSIYLVATSAMDFFDAIDAIGSISLSGSKEENWYSEKAREAMENGDIVYAGKYSAPDYETIVSVGCDLAIESTMIYHKPEVKEMLEQFGIPVMVEHSSYESEPLGRSEWIKFYASLMNKEDTAQELFEEMVRKVDEVLADTESMLSVQTEAEGSEGIQSESLAETDQESLDRPLVAFFSINSTGAVNVRKSGDYVPKMIEMAGGEYVLKDLWSDDSLSTMNMQMEEFYSDAKDSDYVIYNSTIEGAITSIEELIDKNSLLSDFKAVKEGKVYCTTDSLFQCPTSLADMIVDMHNMLLDNDDYEYTYLYKVK